MVRQTSRTLQHERVLFHPSILVKDRGILTGMKAIIESLATELQYYLKIVFS